MSEQHTIVVEFADGHTPTYSAKTEVLGGRVVAVDFDGNRLAVAEELLQALQDLLFRYEFDGVPNDSVQFVQRARAAIAKATDAPSRSEADTDRHGSNEQERESA